MVSHASGPRGILVLSPHLDDAALSVGAVLGSSAGSRAVSVLSFFTECGAGAVGGQRITHAARSFLSRSGWAGDPEGLYARRRSEDVQALAAVGVSAAHAGLADAIFRRRALRAPVAALQRALPAELCHRYPTYRFDAARGRVARGDVGLREELAELVIDAVRRLQPALVLAPLGVGRHVDHVLVRDAAVAAVAAPTVLAHYADMPYARRLPVDGRFVRSRGLRRVLFDDGLDAKVGLIRGYASQVHALYPQGVPRLPDELWWPSGNDPREVLAGAPRRPDGGRAVSSPWAG